MDNKPDPFFLAKIVARNGGICTRKERAFFLSYKDPYMADQLAGELRWQAKKWEDVEKRDQELWHSVSRTQLMAQQAFRRLTKLARDIQAVHEPSRAT